MGNQQLKVIFVRAELDLVRALDARLQEEREENPGQKISRSDLARRLMYAGLGRKKQLVPFLGSGWTQRTVEE